MTSSSDEDGPQNGAAESREQRRRRREEKLAKAFSGPIEPVRTSLLCRLGLLLVAVVMLFLPLLYVALTACVASLVVYHAVENFNVLTESGGTLGRFAVYFGPIIAGVTMALLMVKPLLARRPKRALGHVLATERHPFLFEFIERLCQAVGAPMPRIVVVDLEVNASASFRRGFWSFLGNDLVLTIGLPLIQGLTIQNFAGVLAHEFGHFSQDAGMRLTYIIRNVNEWFARVVYERDSWDLALARVAEKSVSVVRACLLMANVAVWLSRRVLWCFMMVGHVFSCFMLRQMEYDADLHQARLAGSDTFGETYRRLYLLDAAASSAEEHVLAMWQENQERVGSFPAVVAQQARELSPQRAAEIVRAMGTEKTHLLATHPSISDRLARARKADADPAFALSGPATALFYDFDALARRLTKERYDIRAPYL